MAMRVGIDGFGPTCLRSRAHLVETGAADHRSPPPHQGRPARNMGPIGPRGAPDSPWAPSPNRWMLEVPRGLEGTTPVMDTAPPRPSGPHLARPRR
jgi:hypothetical protein